LELRLFQAVTLGGESWCNAGLDSADPRATFGELVMIGLTQTDDPPLHLDLIERVDGKDEHFASIRFDYPGTWEIVEPDAPLRRLAGTQIDPDAYAAGDPKAMQYGRG
jgi:hypothetical protein